MDIAKLLSCGQSRSTTEAIVNYIGSDKERFAELMAVFYRDDLRMQQCAAWPISVVAENDPKLVEPYLAKLIAYLPRQDVHAAVRRSVVRLLQFVEVPRRLHGKVFSHCVDLLSNPNEPIGIRCFALTVAARVAEDHPALLNELRLVAEKQRDQASAGLRVRIRRLFSEP